MTAAAVDPPAPGDRRTETPQSRVQPFDVALLAAPTVILLLLAAAPIALIFYASFGTNISAGGWTPGFSAENYARFAEPQYVKILTFSLFISALVAALAVAIGFPFAWFLTRLSRRTQIVWLVFILAVLSLSEVLVAFSWQVLLSKTLGIPNWLFQLGLMPKKMSMQPGFWAVVVSMTYTVTPYTLLLFYPPLSRLDPSLTEAARTMGATPMRTFFTVVLPNMRMPIIGGLILVFVYVLGAYVTPTQLGRPQHWTMSVHITDQATTAFNLPFASAMAIILMVVALGLVLATSRLAQEGGKP